MKIIEFLKPNLTKILLTIFFCFLVYLIGVSSFNNRIFFKNGCAPNPGCPGCEMCVVWKFPHNINYFSLLLVLVFYGFASLIFEVTKKYHQERKLVILTKIIFLMTVSLIFTYFYYLRWHANCIVLQIGIINPSQIKRTEKCPSFFNPFSWDEFEKN